MKKYGWWLWPKNLDPKFSPWFVILWKVFFIIPFYLGLYMSYLALLLSHGPDHASQWLAMNK